MTFFYDNLVNLYDYHRLYADVRMNFGQDCRFLVKNNLKMTQNLSLNIQDLVPNTKCYRYFKELYGNLKYIEEY